MGIFSEADRHPFFEADSDVIEEARGGTRVESWLEDGLMYEYVHTAQHSRQLFIHDDQVA